jgi:IPT/TIG domain-containing protein/matrixin
VSRARLNRRLVHLGASLGCLVAACVFVGFVQIRFNPGSDGFKWPTTTVRFVIQDSGSDDVPDKSDESALRLAFRAWEQVPDSFVRFSEDTFADASRTDYTANDIHLVMWDEDSSSGLFPDGSNVIALTPILASTVDGTILDADIVFNGELRFTTDPGQQGTRFDVQAVATHEVGHFIGFDHSGGTFSTMFASIPSGSTYCRSLERDDEAGAAMLYGTGPTTRGTISGSITLVGGGNAAYAQVVAIHQLSGAVGGQALCDANGNYTLAGLLPGTYELYAEPVNGPFGLSDTIGFKNENASAFPTTFNVGNPVSVTAGQTLAASWAVPNQAPGLNVTNTAGGQVSTGDIAALALAGTGLDKITSVSVSGTGVLVTGLSSQSATGLIVSVAANAGTSTGIRTLTLHTATSEIAVVTAGVEVIAPFPVVSSVTPLELQAQGGQTLTVSGSGFAEGSQVVVGGQIASGIFVESDGNSLTCVAPPSPGTTVAQDVVVIRPDGREARLRDVVFYEEAPVPTSVDPALGPLSGGTVHTVKGGGFAAPLQVFFAGVEAQVLSVTGDAIQVRLPPSSSTGAVDVSVTAGGKTGLLPKGLTYVDGAAPFIDSLSPDRGGTAGGTSVSLRGSGFVPNAEVRFGGTLGAVTATSDTEIVVTTPAHAAGQVEVRVTNPTTSLSSVSLTPFTFDDTPPPAAGGGSSDDCRIGSDEPGSSGLSLLLLFLALIWARARRPGA